AQPLCVAAEVVGDLVAARVPVGVAGEPVTREGAVPARGEQPQAVVVARLRPNRLVTGLVHHRLTAAVTPSTGHGQAPMSARPTRTHEQARPACRPVLVPIWTSGGAGVQHPPDVACSGASNRPDPPHTPVSGSSSSTRSAAS